MGAAGLLGLAYISLLDRGSSRMFAEPGIWFYWSALISPGILLLVRLWTGAPSIRLPASPWLWLFGASWVVLLSAALASPYRSQCLPWTAPLLAGMAVFVWLHDWIQSAPENPIRLARYHAMGAGLLMLASTYYWLLDISQLTAAQFFSVTLFEIRNPHPLGHSNYTAGLALLCLPVLAQQVRHSNHRYRRLALFAVTLSVFVLFTSGSRGGLLGLAALGITMVVGSSRPRRQIVWLLAGIVAVAGIMAVANPRIRAFFAPADRQAPPNISQVQREAMITAGLLMDRTGLFSAGDSARPPWSTHATALNSTAVRKMSSNSTTPPLNYGPVWA